MQSQQFPDPSLYNMYPSEEDNLFGSDNVLFRNVSDPYPVNNAQDLNLMLPPMEYQPQEQDNNLLPLIAPLVNPLGNDLVDAVSRMNMGENQVPTQNNPRHSLSLDIKPCISVTEPTPVQRNMPTLRFVDDFIAQHEFQLDTLPEQQQQQQQQDMSMDLSMDPNFILNDLLLTEPGATDWLSWTPMGGNSPASVVSTSFDEQSYSPQPSASIYLNMMSASAEDLLGSSSLSWGYPSPSLSDYSDNGSYDNNLTVKKDRRARRVSEPPMVSPSLQEQFLAEQPNQVQTQDRAIRRSKSDSRRGRSNSSASSTGNHICPHPGCGKSFTRPYNLTSHMRTHTADRPFACSQCGRRFARQHDRNRHEKLHWGVKPYACSFCNKPFARMDALNRHLRVENGCQQRQQQQQQQQA